MKKIIRSITPIPLRRFMGRLGHFMAAGIDSKGAAGGGFLFPSVEASLSVLKSKGFDPRFCIDVGAYHGEWTRMFRSLFPASEVVMIEGQEAKQQRLHQVESELNPGVTSRIALLGPQDGREVEFFEMETGSSVFQESSSYGRTAVKRTLVTLDTLIQDETRSRTCDFLKLDTQGYELEILRGANNTLAAVQFVLMECSLIPINAGCPLFAEAIAFMDERGFALYDFCSQTRRHDGVLWQTDLLFVRKGSSLCPDARLTTENWG